MDPEFAVVYVTTPDKESASKLSEGLVEAKLAACVNCIPNISSVYRWEGKVENAAEFLLIIKTRLELIGELETFVVAHHPYEVPEIIGFPIQVGHRPYMDWIGASVGPQGWDDL